MSGFDYFKDVLFNNYANFEGRARRSEYWYFVLYYMICFLVLGLVGGILSAVLGETGGILMAGLFVIAGLGLIIPTLAVQIRRLHDTNKSGWMILISAIPFVGGIIMLVFMVTEGNRGENQYGPDPKVIEEEATIQDNLV